MTHDVSGRFAALCLLACPVIAIAATELDVIRLALNVGQVSFDGDPWYASGSESSSRVVDDMDAGEAAFRDAFAALATLDAARASQPAPADPEWQYPVPGVAVKSPAPAGVRDPEPPEDRLRAAYEEGWTAAESQYKNRDPKPRPDLAAALRLSADRLHSLSQDLEHQRWTFDECPARYCVEARAALRSPEPRPDLAAALDVERLARVLTHVRDGMGEGYFGTQFQQYAANIAREYVALAHPDPKEPREDAE